MLRLVMILEVILSTPTTSQACWWYHRRPVHRPVCRPCPCPCSPAPAPAPAPQPTPQTTAQWSTTDEAGAFLAALNAYRAAYGRHPVSWDVNLAAWAATNAGIHDGRCNQCWSGQRSLLRALAAWEASPAHASILLSANEAVGASPCPSGATLNAR